VAWKPGTIHNVTWDGLQADVIDSEHDVLLMLYKPHGRFLTNEDKEENLIRIVAKDLEQMTGIFVARMDIRLNHHDEELFRANMAHHKPDAHLFLVTQKGILPYNESVAHQSSPNEVLQWMRLRSTHVNRQWTVIKQTRKERHQHKIRLHEQRRATHAQRAKQYITDDQGISKVVITKGDRFQKPRRGDSVVYHITERCANTGRLHDTSRERHWHEEPRTTILFHDHSVTPCVTLGLLSMHVGEDAIIRCNKTYAYYANESHYPSNDPNDPALEARNDDENEWEEHKDLSTLATSSGVGHSTKVPKGRSMSPIPRPPGHKEYIEHIPDDAEIELEIELLSIGHHTYVDGERILKPQLVEGKGGQGADPNAPQARFGPPNQVPVGPIPNPAANENGANQTVAKQFRFKKRAEMHL